MQMYKFSIVYRKQLMIILRFLTRNARKCKTDVAKIIK